jgi:phage terminase small subunit
MTSKTTKKNTARQNQRGQAESPLPVDWQLFLAEYMKDGNGRRAAEAVGKSPATARVWAYKTLSKPAVKLELARMRDKVMGSITWEIQDSLRELASIAMFDLADFYEDLAKGRIHNIDDIPPEVRRCIKKIEMGVFGEGEKAERFVKKVEFYDRMAAIDQLNKHKGFYKADNEQKSDAVAQLIALVQAQQGTALAVRK